ncbi:hypothetical protein V8C86DRAFT_2524392 [Haematococcus lacustris]
MRTSSLVALARVNSLAGMRSTVGRGGGAFLRNSPSGSSNSGGVARQAPRPCQLLPAASCSPAKLSSMSVALGCGATSNPYSLMHVSAVKAETCRVASICNSDPSAAARLVSGTDVGNSAARGCTAVLALAAARSPMLLPCILRVGCCSKPAKRDEAVVSILAGPREWPSCSPSSWFQHLVPRSTTLLNTRLERCKRRCTAGCSFDCYIIQLTTV